MEMEHPLDGRYGRLAAEAGRIVLLSAAALIASSCAVAAHADEVWSFEPSNRGRLEIRLHGKHFATYSYSDEQIPRPYFANIRLPSGIQVTRNHPVQPGDAEDHALLHPGLWLAFGDLSSADFWRLTARVENVVPPAKTLRVEGNGLQFAVENRYMSEDGGRVICREYCRYDLRAYDQGVLLLWASRFSSDEGDFTFGDQEEMGLGVRLATPLTVASKQGGRILNSSGQMNEKDVWGNTAQWCDYSGVVDGQFVGVMIIPDPGNFRPARFHARDYGLLAANPFGRKVFSAGDESQVVVSKAEPFTLKFGVFIHWNESSADFDPDEVYNRYLQIVKDQH